MEKAQEAKRKWCEGDDKGNKTKTQSILVLASDLAFNASVIGIASKDGSPVSDTIVDVLE